MSGCIGTFRYLYVVLHLGICMYLVVHLGISMYLVVHLGISMYLAIIAVSMTDDFLKMGVFFSAAFPT